MSLNLNLDLDLRTLRNSTLPPLTVGSTELTRLRFYQRVGDDRQPVENYLEELTTLRVQLGPVDEPPVEGRIKFELGGAETAWMPWDADAAGMKAALTSAETVAVTAVRKPAPGLWLVNFAEEGEMDFGVFQNELMPRSFCRIRAFEQDGRWWHEVRMVIAPVAWNQTFSRPLAPEPSFERIQAGNPEALDDNGSWGRNEIQRLTIPAEFVGSIQLKLGLRTTTPVGTGADTEDFATALNALFSDGAERFRAAAVDPTGEIDIEFIGPFAAQPFDLLEVVPVSFAPGRVTLELDLDRAEIRPLTWGRRDTTTILELQGILERDTGDGPVEQEKIPMLRTEVVLRRENIAEENAVALLIDWLRPPSRRRYLPPNVDQVRTGPQYAIFPGLGDGETSTIVQQHALGTASLHVTVRRISDGLVLTDYTTTIDDQEITLVFPEPPAEDSIELMVIAAEAVSQWQGHGHTIEEIEDLTEALADIAADISVLQGLVSVPGTGTVAPTYRGNILLPATAEIYPALIDRGTKEKPQLELAPLPRAIRATSTTSITEDIDLPEAREAPGAVYAFAADDVTAYAPGDWRRRGREWNKSQATHLISDGYYWWGAIEGPEDVYYPIEMDRLIGEVAVTPEMLAPGRTLRLVNTFMTALMSERSELRGAFMLRVRKGIPTAESSFGEAPNIEDVVWDTVEGAEELLMEQRITLTSAGMFHQFGLEIARAAGGELSATKTIYGQTTPAEPPQSTHFVLRAELSRFDLTNYSKAMGLPLGQIYLKVGNADGDTANAIRARFPSDADSNLLLAASIS